MTARAIIESVGITAAIGVLLIVSLCIWANMEFKARDLSVDDEGEDL